MHRNTLQTSFEKKKNSQITTIRFENQKQSLDSPSVVSSAYSLFIIFFIWYWA